MPQPNIETGLQLRSLVTKSGVLEVSLESVPTPNPADDEIVIRVEATPINPSDIALLLGPIDLKTARKTSICFSSERFSSLVFFWQSTYSSCGCCSAI